MDFQIESVNRVRPALIFNVAVLERNVQAAWKENNAKVVRYLNANHQEILTEFEAIAATEGL